MGTREVAMNDPHAHHLAPVPTEKTLPRAHHENPATVAHKHQEHGEHAGHSVETFRRKFWVSLVLTIPTLLWGHMLPAALRYPPPAVPGKHFIPAIFGTAV